MNCFNFCTASGFAAAFSLLAGCAEEPQPRSVQQFLDDPIVLEATMVRCNAHRDRTRYEAECVNARQAVSAIEAREERERQKALERQSEQKREALRRTQRAAAEARRRAAEAERLRREAEYLAQFGELPPDSDGDDGSAGAANQPGMVLPPASSDPGQAESTSIYGGPEPVYEEPAPAPGETTPATDAGNAPQADTAPADLDAVREELRRRSGGDH